MSWGSWLFVAILAFMTMILYMVYRSTQEHVSLVTENYYAHELEFTEKQQKRSNARALGDSFRMDQQGKTMVLIFPPDHADLEGNVKCYRPSDETLDISFPIVLDSTNTMMLPLGELMPGLWHIFVDWTADGEAFYVEDSFIR